MKENTLQFQRDLQEIDDNIHNLVQQIELLDYVNPINIEEEKRRFFNSNFTHEPKFEYRDLDFDPHQLHSEFFNQKLEKIEDPIIRELYYDIVYYYTGIIQCIQTIGKGEKFYYNSLRSFGTPTEKDVGNAKFILHFRDEKKQIDSLYNSDEAESFFHEEAKKYAFPVEIVQSDKISAIAMVLNNKRRFVINKNHLYTSNELNVLSHHEIGVHMVTTMNALLHPLKIFSHGFPKNVQTQEGLAVFSEYMSGNLTLKRLKELAFRVIAVDSLAKGYSFIETFNKLHIRYKLDQNTAFYISVRVHRGGGFTKDHLYLSGLKQIYDFHKDGNDLNPLLSGKVSLKYLKEIKHLQAKGLAIPSRHITPAYSSNDNKNPLINQILENLK
jgi:uncharacterized protein (TIGR02421 family)